MKSTSVNKCKKLSDDLYVITETESVHCYVILGSEKAVVFDIGYGYENIMPLVREITPLPVMLVLSHGDPDHGLGASQFDDVWLHELDYGKLLWNDTLQMRERALGYRLKKMPELAGEIDEKAYFEQHIYQHTTPHFLKDHELIELGGKTLEVLHTPGHSYGHIMLLDKQKKRLFSGDQVTLHNIWYFGSSDQQASFHTARESLRKILARSSEYVDIYPAHDEIPIDSQVVVDLLECLESELRQNYQHDEEFHSFIGGQARQHFYKTTNIIYSDERLSQDMQEELKR